MAKIVSRSKFMEWKGLDHISLVVHEMNCIWREITKDDFGIDGEIEVVVPTPDGLGFHATGGVLKVQARSGQSYIRGDSANQFAVAVEKAELEYWHKSPFPVLLVVYHPRDDKLYWKDVKSYARTQATLRVPYGIVFDKPADEFTKASYEKICRIAEVSPPRVSLQQRERLYTNLLLVKRWPRRIFSAPTSYDTYDAVRRETRRFLPPFLVRGDRLYSLSDLRDDRCVARTFCDPTEVSEHAPEEWFRSPNLRRDFVFMLNQLLGIHLRRCGLRYSRDFDRNYFPVPDDGKFEFKLDWWNVRTGKPAQPRIVTKHYRYGPLRFWRHLAVNLSFRRFGESWFLQVIPKYFFTEDGETPWASDMVGPYTTRLKALERNIRVLNHILFWADVLSQHKPAIHISLDSKTIMVIEKNPLSGIANFAIPHDPALYHEDDEHDQLNLPAPIDLESEDDIREY